jgi:hypothetical protein
VRLAVCCWLSLAATLALDGPARAAEGGRLVVMILPAGDRDRQLADSLTEVAIAQLAKTGPRELAGLLEVRRRWQERRALRSCLEDAACGRRFGRTMGGNRAVVGELRRQRLGFRLHLELRDLRDARQLAEAVEEVPADPEALVSGLRAALDRLFRPTLPSLPPRAAVVSAPPNLDLFRREPPTGTAQKKRHWPAYAVYGGATIGALLLVGGGVFGTLGEAEPIGLTRAETQTDLERRKDYARLGTTLLVGGAALTTGAAVVLIRYWRDIRPD